MDHALQHVPWEACLLEPQPDRALETYVRRKQGMPMPTIRYFSQVPWFARALVDLHPKYGLLVHLDPHVSDLLMLVVSQENSCRFCFAAVRAMLWAQGMPKERIDRIEHDMSRADLPGRTVAALAFGRAQSRLGPAGAAEARAALRQAGYDEAELFEVAYAVAVSDFSNRAHTIPAVSPEPLERIPDQFMMRLLRPLIGRIFDRHRWQGRAGTAVAATGRHPYAGLVRLCAESPIAPVLQQTLEAMWESPHLTRRCKLLLLAVIARGLSSARCEAELSAALREEGMSDASIQQVLNHLDAPELDAIERVLVPFARETIWYQPAVLQRHARALSERLSTPQFVEAIGVTALGNGLCRMNAMVASPA